MMVMDEYLIIFSGTILILLIDKWKPTPNSQNVLQMCEMEERKSVSK